MTNALSDAGMKLNGDVRRTSAVRNWRNQHHISRHNTRNLHQPISGLCMWQPKECFFPPILSIQIAILHSIGLYLAGSGWEITPEPNASRGLMSSTSVFSVWNCIFRVCAGRPTLKLVSLCSGFTQVMISSPSDLQIFPFVANKNPLIHPKVQWGFHHLRNVH